MTQTFIKKPMQQIDIMVDVNTEKDAFLSAILLDVPNLL